jgi:hypothetical protein
MTITHFPKNSTPRPAAGCQKTRHITLAAAILLRLRVQSPSASPGSASLRLPLAGKLLGFGDLRARHLRSDNIPSFCRFFVSTRRSQVEPHVREDIVLRDTLAEVVLHSEQSLSQDVPLLGGLAIPTPCGRIVLWHAVVT